MESCVQIVWAARSNPRLAELDLSGNRAGPFFGTTKHHPPGPGTAVEQMIEGNVAMRVRKDAKHLVCVSKVAIGR